MTKGILEIQVDRNHHSIVVEHILRWSVSYGSRAYTTVLLTGGESVSIEGDHNAVLKQAVSEHLVRKGVA